MSIQDDITADQAAITAAQEALDAAHAKMATDQAAYAAIQPHVSLWDETVAEAEKLGADAAAPFIALAARAKALLGV